MCSHNPSSPQDVRLFNSACVSRKMRRFNIFFMCAFFCTCLARVPSVTIPGQGKIAGVEVSKLRVQKIVAYYGIPYALPPVGKLRFAPPVTDPLPEVANYTGYPPSCPQSENNYKDSVKQFLQLISEFDFKSYNFSEDCLYLNIFVPVGNGPKAGFPTIIWFHPGSFVIGTPSIWNPHTLVYRQRVIIVTVAWRLNILGFFSTLDGEAPGNYGLLDQQAAMLWVKKNIALFGGNPDNICLMGYGAGATSIGLHMVSPGSRDLFNKAIAMSGDYLSPSVVKMPKEDKELIDILPEHCERKPTSKLVECLRNADVNELVDLTSKISWRPLLDAGLSNSSPAFMPDLPINYYERGDYNQIPFLTGYTHMEQILDVGSLNNITDFSSNQLKSLLTKLIDNDLQQNNDTESSCIHSTSTDAVIFFYSPTRPIKDVDQFRQIVAGFISEKNVAAPTYLQATYLNQQNTTYVYRFDMKPRMQPSVSQIPEWVTVPHLFDLIYVWGVPYWEKTGIEWDIGDKRISDSIMSLWTNFAKSSNPNANNIYPIKWDAFTKDDLGILLINSTFNMNNSNSLNYKAFDFWNEYYPKVKDAATKCCGYSGSTNYSQKNWLWVIVSFAVLYRF